MNKTPSPNVAARGPVDHEVRDQIVAAATEHFRLYGYEKTTVSDLAKAIGFSKAYIYKFFESKQAIGEMICSNCLRLFFQDRKLYEIAASAASGRWPATLVYEGFIEQTLREILQLGRHSGDFERKTPLDETTRAIHLIMRPYFNPLLLQYGLDTTDEAPALLSSLILRSLSPCLS